ncbi:MAG: YdcF family protein [Planctomycetota bacterium]
MRIRQVLPSISDVGRGASLGLGAFALFNLLRRAIGGFDVNLWWIDLRFLPEIGQVLVLAIAASVLLAHGVGLTRTRRMLRVTAGVAVALAIVALVNAVQYTVLLSSGRLTSGIWLPASLPIALTCLLSAWSTRGVQPLWTSKRRWLVNVPCLGIAAAGFPILMCLTYGQTDYRRSADAIVVFGAKAYADGSASLALWDRVQTGCELYHEGLAPKLILSGGPGAGAYHETEVMQRLALEAAVPADAIVLDPGGTSTQETVRALTRITPSGRVLAVSQFFHLPRIQLAAQRAGLTVYTVPAQETRPLLKTPWFIAREVGGWWYYYLRPAA